MITMVTMNDVTMHLRWAGAVRAVRCVSGERGVRAVRGEGEWREGKWQEQILQE